MSKIGSDLCAVGLEVLAISDPHEKAKLTQQFYVHWKNSKNKKIGLAHEVPTRPARPEKPMLLHVSQMPKRAKAGTLKSKIALLHALAHIELNAIDLAWDIMVRFSPMAKENNHGEDLSLPVAFFEDWLKVAYDEAKHFLMLSGRLNVLGSVYGDLPAHDGLWESSERTAHDFSARLAIVPMVLEARGLDVTPNMIAAMKSQGDIETADILQTIHDDEITHVRAGTVWFKKWCEFHGHDVETYWQDLVRTYFNGSLKPPFNHDSRQKAEMIRDWYENLALETAS